MTFEQRLIVAFLILFLLWVVLGYVRQQRLSVNIGLLWVSLLVSAILILFVPGLLELITKLTGAKFPVSALTLLAFFALTLFLFYFGILIQSLERKHAALVRSVALLERRLKQRSIASPPIDIGDSREEASDPRERS